MSIPAPEIVVELMDHFPHAIGDSISGSREEITLEAHGVVYKQKHSSILFPWHMVKKVEVTAEARSGVVW